MNRLQQRGWPALRRAGMLLAALLLSVAGAVAATPGGIGGTGIEPGGIGGTGISPGGIGGTGIVAIGPVQRFGSIFVNGGEYELPTDTRYRVDGAPGSEQSLHLGDTVRVLAIERGGRLDALEVRVDHALIGRVAQIDRAGGRLTLLGQTVALPPSTLLRTENDQPLPLAALSAGDVVRISALNQGGGRWQALRVVQLGSASARGQADTPFLLRGRLEAVRSASRQVRIAGVWFQVTQGASRVLLKPGAEVVVHGLQDAKGEVITAIDKAPAIEAPVGTRVVMAGYVLSGPQGLESHGLHIQGATALLKAQLASAANASQGPALIEGILLGTQTVAVERVIPQVDAMQYALPPLAGAPSQGASPKAADANPAASGWSGVDLSGRSGSIPAITAPLAPTLVIPNVAPPAMPTVPQAPQMPSINAPMPPAVPVPPVPSVAPPVVAPPSVMVPNAPVSPQMPSLPRP